MSDHESTDPQILSTLARIERKVDGMDVLLRGSDDGSIAGLVTRVDRIEQKEARRDQIGIGIGIAVLGAFATSLWALITGHK